MAGSSEIDAVVESVTSQLRALDAIGSDIPGTGLLEADQIRFVRLFVEEGIDQLARNEEALFALIAECAMLAGENMQDARLDVIEDRLEPEPATFAGFLVNLGLMLALELVVVAGATYALPALLAIAATSVRSQNARRLVIDRIAEKHRASQALEALAKTAAEKQRAYHDELAKPELRRLALETSKARIAASKAVKDYSVALQAVETSEELVRRAKEAVEAPAKPVLDGLLKSPRLQAFLEDVVAPTTVARVAENSASAAIEELGQSPASAPFPGRFQTSTLVGLFLAETGRQRNEAAEAWAATKLHIRMLTDDQFLESELAQQLFLSVHYEPASAAAQDLAATDREAMILGFEGALWLTWLRAIDALGKSEVSGVPVIGGVEGGVHGTLFIEHVTVVEGSDPSEHFGTVRTERFADGTVYPGLAKIRDGHAEYLYGRFAHGFFTESPEHVPPPLVFEPARYVEVASLAVNGPLGPNEDRLGRVAEMKLLVIEFFRLFSESPEAIGGVGGQEARQILRGLLELAADDDPVTDYLESVPPIKDSDVSAPEEGEFDDLLPPQDPVSQLEDSSERMARDAATKLASLVTDLDLLITQAPSTEAEEHLQAIASQQDAVRRQFADFQSLASGQTALLDEVRTAYEARIDRLAAWPPPAWKFYPPEDPPIA
jgi:hypothetical protein